MSMFDSGSGATVGTTAERGPAYQVSQPGNAQGVSSDPIYNMLAAELRALGLGDLVRIGADGQPSGWLWQQLQAGFDTSEELMLALEQTSSFKDRFGVIEEQKRRAGLGQPVYVMSPAEVIEYENRAKQIMTAGGMPSWFYDQPADFHDLILNDMSLVELEERVTQVYEYVENAPPEVASSFEDFFGVGEAAGALAAYVLDPSRTTAQLERATRTAYTAGMAKRFDIELGRVAAERIADLPTTEAGIVDGLSTISAQSNLFQNQLFEDGSLTAEDQGVGAVFEGDADAIRDIERRRQQRQAGNRAATGGAVMTQRGVTGAGSA